jgi:hypothetical protein
MEHITMAGPVLPFCDYLHETKYRSKGEAYTGYSMRASRALADDAEHEAALLEIFNEFRHGLVPTRRSRPITVS